ncbi:MAG: Endoribonuclease [Gemmatimonadetes bacterium]|nr:Endoribonuclease [Gemmatimonadota bacterium]
MSEDQAPEAAAAAEEVPRHPVVQPDGWMRAKGFSQAVIAKGRTVSIAGQIGWNPETQEFTTDDFVGQCEQALKNIVTILDAAGAAPENLTRLTWYITNRAHYMVAKKQLGVVYKAVMGTTYPPMSVVIVAGLLEPRAKVEIEATAQVPY